MTSGSQKTAFLDYLITRRTVPAVNLEGPAPDEGELQKMLEIAARVPDHGKIAPWRFIHYPPSLCQSVGSYLSKLWQAENPNVSAERISVEEMRFVRAPSVIGVISRPVRTHKVPVWEQELSAGAVCLNLIHAAAAHGYSAQWLTEWYSFHDEAARYLGADEGERFAGFIHIGRPMISPNERPRPTMSDITSTWSKPK